MPTLDSILNWAIPVGLIVFFAAVVFSRFRQPLQEFYYWIKDLFGWGKDKIVAGAENLPSPSYTQIVYR